MPRSAPYLARHIGASNSLPLVGEGQCVDLPEVTARASRSPLRATQTDVEALPIAQGRAPRKTLAGQSQGVTSTRSCEEHPLGPACDRDPRPDLPGRPRGRAL